MNGAIRHGAALATVVVTCGVVAAGCLTRPVAKDEPVTKTNVSLEVPNTVIDKIDMLFDIDNSASMGDKQSYLSQAIPDLIARLVTPNCLDATGAVIGKSANGLCSSGKIEFHPVHDMHLGIVSSSLGERLGNAKKYFDSQGNPVVGNVCLPAAAAPMPYQALSRHNDDQGHLISRYNPTATTEATVQDASAAGFLYWFPGTMSAPVGPATPLTNSTTLITDFQELVGGAGIFGCGIESQLESWYRFLIQPDPYASLEVDANARAQWSGVDGTIIQQRHDFLRPDSLVVVVVLSDENDSEIDVRSIGGSGYYFMDGRWNPSHATSQCANNPGDPSCTICQGKSTDSACTSYPNGYTALNDWGKDLNLRHVHMKQKYGIDPQFPIGRYLLGLTWNYVPNRDGEYPAGKNYYIGDVSNVNSSTTCTNPLFAASLPSVDSTGKVVGDLCKMAFGPRTKDQIFYAHIGGVPYQLLHYKDGNLAASKLTQDDWVRILGKGPAAYTIDQPPSYDYTGIDPHMVESYADRSATPVPTGGYPVAPMTASNTADPISGREWQTDIPAQPSPSPALTKAFGMNSPGHRLPVDRQYACTFLLAKPRDCSFQTTDPNGNACDCPGDLHTGTDNTSGTGTYTATLTPAQIPPVCDPANPTTQVKAKAYPTIRELTLAKLMGDQGIVSSICPQETVDTNSAVYGYRPAVAVIIDKLKAALTNACLPEKLQQDTDGSVPCLILVQRAPSNDGGTCKNPVCDNNAGLFGPGSGTLTQDALNSFCDTKEAAYVGPKGVAGDPALQSVCQLQQLTPMNTPTAFDSQGSCSTSKTAGWCYTAGAAANGCPQAVQFASVSPPPGSITNLECIEQSINVLK